MNPILRIVTFSWLIFLFHAVFAEGITQLNISSIDGKLRISWEVDLGFSTVCEVERSEDGKHFSPIARLDILFFDEVPVSYNVEDENVSPGVLYFYRISYKDAQGNWQRSETITKSADREIFLMGEFFPNPTYTGHVSIECRALENCEVTLTVISTQGIELFSGKQNFLMGDHVMDLNFPEIPAGLYFVKLETTEWIQFKGFVVE